MGKRYRNDLIKYIEDHPLKRLTIREMCNVARKVNPDTGIGAVQATMRAISEDVNALPGKLDVVVRGQVWKYVQDLSTSDGEPQEVVNDKAEPVVNNHLTVVGEKWEVIGRTTGGAVLLRSSNGNVWIAKVM